MRRAVLAVVLAAALAVEGEELIRAAGRQSVPVVATNGEDFLAVWLDTRGGGSELYATAVRSDGTVVTPMGVNAGFPDTLCDDPVVVWDGSAYVIAWRSDYDVRMMRVDAEGRRIDAEPRTIFDNVLDRRPVFIASNGNGSIVVVNGRANGPDLMQIAAFDRGGMLIAKSARPAVNTYNVAAIDTPGGYTVFASRSKDLVAWSVDSRAEVLDAEPRVIANHVQPSRVRAARSGDVVLLAYSHASLVAQLGDGAAFSAPFVVSQSGDRTFALTADSNGFLFAHGREVARITPPFLGDVVPRPEPVFDIDALRVSRDGRVSPAQPLVQGRFSDEFQAIAATDRALFAVWIEDPIVRFTARIAAGITHSSAPVKEIALAQTARRQWHPVIAEDLVAWEEEPENDAVATVMARFRNREPFPLPLTGYDHRLPAVAFDGERYLVTWVEQRPGESRVVGRFVGRHGNAEGLPFDISEAGIDSWMRPAVATNGDGFMVVYGSSYAIPFKFGQKVRIVRVNRDRSVSLVLSHEPGRQPNGSEFAIASGSGGYVAAWSSGNAVDGLLLNSGRLLFSLPTLPVRGYSDLPTVACTRIRGCAYAFHDSQYNLAVSSVFGSGTQSVFASSYNARLTTIGDAYIAFARSGTKIIAWQPDAGTISTVVDRRLIGDYAVSPRRDGRVGLAYIAPVPALGGVTRVHVTSVAPR